MWFALGFFEDRVKMIQTEIETKKVVSDTKFFGPAIFTYTSKQAVEDGVLFRISDIPAFKNTNFNLATVNLMSKGYLSTEDAYGKVTANIPNLMDLLTQVQKYVINQIKKKGIDTFYAKSVEAPSGARMKIFIAQNETGPLKFTLMLPEDY